jgi:hypothetical protein
MLFSVHEVLTDGEKRHRQRRTDKHASRVRTVELDDVGPMRMGQHHCVDDVGDAEAIHEVH